MNPERLVPGSIFGGMLLVAGSCIGAGMLALPILTGLSGFFPSVSMIFLSWAFMTFTGLLLIEVNGWFFGQVNLLSMVQESLGSVGRCIAWIAYLFLFYSVLVAYISASGTIFSNIFESFFGWHVKSYFCSICFTLLFGWIIYLGTRPVDLWNRVLMVGLVLSYFGMIALGIARIDSKLLMHFSPSQLFISLPILVVSFGFQNLIPSLTAYMKGDLKRVRITIIGGSLITLVVYVLWSLFFLGIVPYAGTGGILDSYLHGEEATSALKSILGSSRITYFAQGFAFFAIVTSFLAQGLTLMHFLADGFHVVPTKDWTRWLCLLTLVPPLVFALFYPQVFFKALNFAGGICAMVLFGILPVFMVWIGRYYKKETSNYHVFGGKPILVFTLLFSVIIIVCELVRLFS